MRRVQRAVLAAGLSLLALSLSACTIAASTNAVADVTATPTGTPTLNSALAYQSAWHVVATSKYVNGSADICDLHLAIAIEDAGALSDSNVQVPIFGFVARDGEFGYGTVWPTSVPGTGILSGKGSYRISYDSEGLPANASGRAELVWHDPKASPQKSTRTDLVKLIFTKEPRAGHCD